MQSVIRFDYIETAGNKLRLFAEVITMHLLIVTFERTMFRCKLLFMFHGLIRAFRCFFDVSLFNSYF